MELVIDASAVAKGNVLIPLDADKLFGAFQGIGMYKATDVMFFIEKVSDFELLHMEGPLSSPVIEYRTLFELE